PLGEIRVFSQHENETLTDALLHMKEMLRNCHGHNISKGGIIKIFYHGLNEATQEAPNAAAGEEPSFLPVIISSQLFTENKSKLLSVLRKHKEAFAWKTIDIPGICPSFCKHKIQLLDDKKLVVQKQRRLNPNMQEGVKKEIVKLLDTGWRIYIDYRKLNEATAKDHFPLPFMDQSTFQRCMLAIFDDMIEESVDVFMDDFFVFVKSFNKCLNNLDKMLQHCKDAHLVLNWEKCHFMVKEGIVLGYKVSDFSKIARPLTKLLEKDTPFEFSDECQKTFEVLKEKLTCAPVILSLNWNLPFELTCDASDFVVVAVLGQKDG
ncbi:DNA-directed DNA polymerase, partial [Tanacetum coccineum]